MLKYLNSGIYDHIMTSFDHYFPKMKDVSCKFVCVDYIPLSLFKGSLCYGVIEASKGANYTVTFRTSIRSTARAESVLRNHNISGSAVLAGLDRVLQILDTKEKTGEVIENIRKLLPISQFEFISEYLGDTNSLDYSKALAEILPKLIEVSAYLDNDSWEDIKSGLIPVCESLKTLLDKYLHGADTLEDLMAYAALSTGNIDEFYDIEYIPEITAVNIITPRLKQMKQENKAEYDKHMFIANYEMLRLFTYKSHAGSFKYPMQNTFSTLSEFVPIAMKFKNIYNPLFDNGAGLWGTLQKGYRWMQLVECCDNKCSYNGFVIDQSSDTYAESNVESYHLGRIYYGLCSDIDEAFNNERTPIVPERTSLGGVLYSTDLAAALIYRMLVNEGVFKSTDFGGTISWYADTLDDKEYLAVCSLDKKPLYAIGYNHTSNTDFIYTMIYRTILTSSPNYSESFDLQDTSITASLMQQKFNSLALNTFGGF